MSKINGPQLLAEDRWAFKTWALVELYAKFQNQMAFPKDGNFEVHCTINGLEVDFEWLFEKIEESFNKCVENKIQKMREKKLTDIDEFEEKVNNAMEVARETFLKEMDK